VDDAEEPETADVNDLDHAEIIRLRQAVDDLAARVRVSPRHVEPDRVWRGHGERYDYAEWDVTMHPHRRGLRELAVRAGWPDGTPRLFLVDEQGDMYCLRVRDAHRLVDSLVSGIAHVTDNLAKQRALITKEDKPCRR